MSENVEEPGPDSVPPPPPLAPPQGVPYPAAYPQPVYYLPYQYGYPRDHPQAGLALGLGLGGLIGGIFTLGLAFVLGPIAWFIGQRARSEIKRSNGAYHSEGNATAGMVLGIIATVFLVLAILLWVVLITAGVDDGSSSGGGTPA